MKPTSLIFLGAALLSASAWAGSETFVAGLHPDRRPDGAPAVAQYAMTPEQQARALQGVEGTPPGNLVSIVNAGAWFIPLRTRGMTPPYDIRGWHGSNGAPAATASTAASAAR